MTRHVSVERIIARLPVRARICYTNLVTHPDTVYDEYTGWSQAYCRQAEVATAMGCSISTVKRAVADLQHVGIAHVIAWPHAMTETYVRVADVLVRPAHSVFGPIAAGLAPQTEPSIEDAVGILRQHWDLRAWEDEMTHAE